MKQLLITLSVLLLSGSAARSQWDDQNCPKLISPVSVVYDATNSRYIMAITSYNYIPESFVYTYCAGIYHWVSNDSIDILTEPLMAHDIVIVNDTLFYTEGNLFFEMPIASVLDNSHYLVSSISEQTNRGLAYDNNRSIYFSDRNSWGYKDLIWKFNIDTKNISSLSLTGDSLRSPSGIEFDQANNRLISVSNDSNAVIQEIDLDSMKVTTLDTTGLDFLYGITRDGAGNYYISGWGDGQNGSGKIIRYDSTFQNDTIISTGHSQPAHLFYNTATDTLVIPERGADSLTFIGVVFPSAVPIPDYPGEDDTGTEMTLELRWEKTDFAKMYSAQVAKDEGFTDVFHSTENQEYNAVLVENLEPSTLYYWRIKSHNALGESEWSEGQSFTTASEHLPVPELIPPSQNNEPVNIRPALSWNNTDADSYILQIASALGSVVDPEDKSGDIINGGEYRYFPDPEIEIKDITENSITLPDPLDDNMRYYWRVKGIKNGMKSPWADYSEFKTENLLGVDNEFFATGNKHSIQIIPNPVSGNAKLSFVLEQGGYTELAIYNAQGILVGELFHGYLPSGQNDLNWNFKDYGSGVFYLKLIAGTESKVEKLMLVR